MPHTEKNSCGGAYGRAAIFWDFLGQLAGKTGQKELLLDITRNYKTLF